MFTPNTINTVFTVFYWSRAMMLIIYVWNCLLNWNKCIYIYIYSRSRRLYPKQLTVEYTFIQATYNWVFKWTVLNNISFVSVIIVFSLFHQFLDIPTVTSSDVYNVALRYVTIISVSVCVCVGVSPSLSSLLQVFAANYLGRRIGSSLDVAPFKRHASAQDQKERERTRPKECVRTPLCWCSSCLL